MEEIAAYIGLILLLIGFLLLAVSINRGKKIVNYLKQRYPQKWQDIGEPAPGYFNSSNRTRWSKFILKEEYLQFEDSRLTEMGDTQRKLERGTLIFLLVFIVGFGGVAAWFKFFG